MSGAISTAVNMPIAPYPIDNYGGLKQAVQLWADRDDSEFVNQIPNFIAFSMKEGLRLVRSPMTQKEAFLPVVNGEAFVPTDYLQGEYCYLLNGNLSIRETSREEITYMNNSNKMATLDSVKEILFARVGQKYKFYPQSFSTAIASELEGNESGLAVVLGYYYDLPMLVNNTDTNPLLVLCPELILYGALKHACVFMRDTDSEKMWLDRQTAGYKQLNEQIQSEKISTGAVAVPTPNYKAFW